MQDGWLRGDLVIEVAPDAKFVIGLRMCTTKDGTHDVGLAKESSYTAIVDPPDERTAPGLEEALRTHLLLPRARGPAERRVPSG